jgi:pimeloyl-ACP methyl ester carboxylesterase
MDTRTVYQPQKTSRSEFVNIRGLKYHVRHWGREGAPRLFMLHGSRDLSASWQFTVDALRGDWHVIAPDWRGCGLSDWSQSELSYWFHDMIGDLHELLRHYSPEEPATILAHSKGGNITQHYAGLRPARVKKFINVEGYMIGNLDPTYSMKRLDRWLGRVEKGAPRMPRYPSLQHFLERLMKGNPRLPADRALWLAREWCEEQPDGSVLQRIDPQQKRGGIYYFAEGLECWKRITAPVLLIEGGKSDHLKDIHDSGEYQLRVGTFKTRVGLEHFAEASHNVHLDEPEKLAEVSERFLLEQ